MDENRTNGDRDDDLELEALPAELPPIPHEPTREELRAMYERNRKPGFGFWLAVAWTLLYFVATQIIAGIIFGIPIILIAMVLDGKLNDKHPDVFAWMKSPSGSTAILLITVATQFFGLALSWLLLRLWCGKSWKRKIALTRLPSPTQAVLVLLGFPAMIVLAAYVETPIKNFVPTMQELMQKIGVDFEMEGSTELILAIVKETPWALAIFAVAVSPGICEEFFCRGFLAQGLSGRYKNWAVVAIVSFLFGCLHADPQQGVGAALLGLAIHAAYVTTRSLLVAMLVHFANNGLAVVHTNTHLYPVLDPLENVMKAQPYLLLFSAMFLFLAVAYALYQTRSKLAPAEPGMPVWEPEGVSGVELPPPGSGTIVTHDPISPLSLGLVVAGALSFGLVLAFA